MQLHQFKPESQTIFMYDDNGHGVGSVSTGGPVINLRVGKYTMVAIEMHKYHGPIPLNADGTERRRVPKGFWEAYKKWEAGGMWLDGSLCVLGKHHTG